VLNVAVALLPVLLFLAVLVFMDSFKLVPVRWVLLAILVGGAVAVAGAFVNGVVADGLALSTPVLSRYVAPVSEELLKALYVAYLIRRRRVGFLVDAAILGFAVGAGFALVENVDYLWVLRDARIFLWVVRGFGTALIHGSATAIFAMISMALAERHPHSAAVVFLPGLAAAIFVHGLFNQFFLNPLLTTVLLLVALPLLMVVVFERSRAATHAWLGAGFEGDVQLLDTIVSGEVGQTRVGAYLRSLKEHFPGTIVADMLCLIRINLELSFQGKGILIARDAGLDLPVGADVRANLEELRYLEKTIGPTGLLAIKPLLKKTSRDLWHIYMLERAGGAATAARRAAR
jgi:RsiW-degrading membrane proteinase PrsW (M82 family)